MAPDDAEEATGIHCRLDELLGERGMTLTRLSELVGISVVNLSVLKNDRARAIRYSTLAAEEMHRKGRRFRWTDALFRPPFTFLQMYLLRAGFLEGYSGWLLCVLYSFYTFAKYIKLKEIRP